MPASGPVLTFLSLLTLPFPSSSVESHGPAARQHRRTAEEEHVLGRHRYRTDKAAFEEASEAARQMKQYQATKMAERGMLSPLHRRFLLVNLFEDGCFNPGRDEVAFDQFVAMARTSESPRYVWDEDTFRSSYESSLGPHRQHFKSCGMPCYLLSVHMLMAAMRDPRAERLCVRWMNGQLC